ncbi:MAG TPA: acyl-CoA dehydrogenase [bacterium]|nr:acyl-CoA dehydrogenase [bacterium]
MTKLGDYRDRRFVLFEQLQIQDLTKYPKFADHGRDVFEMVIAEAEKFAENVLWPLNEVGDHEQCTYQDGEVKTPEGFKQAHDQYVEGGWLTPGDDPEDGGQGLPQSLCTSCSECFHGANMAFANYPNLTHGAGRLLKIFATPEQKQKYLTRMWSGEWAGTMCLTEPGAGSDLGILKTKAKPRPDGLYNIEGVKTFITGGQHDLTGNIIHPVLARIEGDLPGPKGISIFIVPRNLINPDGSVGANNDVKCTGIEHKMGIKGSATCQLAFGEDGKCVGELLGQPRQGLPIMFHMMNEERLFVATQSLGQASSAYQLALAYARERQQGRHLSQGKNPDAPPAPIIQHPDVRRMLLWMKAVTEGLRSLNYFTGHCLDMTEVSEGDERKMWSGLVEILTPVVKAYGSDMAFRVCENAIQVLGGYGFCSEYRIEQCARDVKIASLYEGTNGIQAMDLLSRKIPMAGGKVFETLMARFEPAITEAGKSALMKPYAERLAHARGELVKAAKHVAALAASKDFMLGFLKATPLLEIFGDVLCAWALLWQANVAEKKLAEIVGSGDRKAAIKGNNEAAFLDGKIQSARFFLGFELPKVDGKVAALLVNETAALDIEEVSFT